jgi:hypothetical protein
MSHDLVIRGGWNQDRLTAITEYHQCLRRR